jgi:hypothetical protein
MSSEALDREEKNQQQKLLATYTCISKSKLI